MLCTTFHLNYLHSECYYFLKCADYREIIRIGSYKYFFQKQNSLIILYTNSPPVNTYIPPTYIRVCTSLGVLAKLSKAKRVKTVTFSWHVTIISLLII